jgi:crotonobetainyl-CoA:carnitine CoA-transferase CaiB-like acyl-CoA transferase
MNPLKDLFVLDLSSVLAGPSVGTFFAELGARVIKVENLNRGGDVTNQWRLPQEKDKKVSAYYASVNYLKETYLLDLKTEEGSAQVNKWLGEADIVIENFKAKDRSKFGVAPEVLRRRFPQLIHCHLKGFWQDDGRVAYDVVLQAEGGFMSMNGTADSGPVKMPVAMIDILAAHQMKEALLLALFQREKTGQGSYSEVSLEEAGLSALTNQASNFLMSNHVAQRIGSQHPNIAPYGDTFNCADGKLIVLAVGSDAQFQLLCAYIGAGELALEVQFQSNSQRVINRPALQQSLSQHIERMDSGDFLRYCHDHEIPAGAIRSIDEVMNSPAAKKMLCSEEQHGEKTERLSSIAFQFKEV